MKIRMMNREDAGEVFEMMRVFYDSPALIHKSSDDVLKRDIEECLSGGPFLEGFIFEESGETIGYAMASKNYTTEYGGLCIWVEDLYLKEGFRSKGYGSRFFDFLEAHYPEAVRFKLEVEPENERAMAAYLKKGYELSGYSLMTREMIEDVR